MLEIPGRFLWDFWTIDAAGVTWLYALSAPRDPNPDSRHNRARVDMAKSRDLKTWEVLGTALCPGSAGDWDDMAIWTGSVAADPAGGYAMLYTGRNAAEGGRVQRIGLARSGDLMTWRKHPGPVLEADPALYRTKGRNGSTNWRDPWLAWNDARGVWQAWITAQHPDGPVETSGCIALAESRDLVSWTHLGPVTDERLTEHLEVPQIVRGGMLLNVYGHHVPAGGRLPQACLSMFYKRDADGTYRFERIVESWPTDSRYVVKQVREGLGLCWQGLTAGGEFLGTISDPFDLTLAPAAGRAGADGG